MDIEQHPNLYDVLELTPVAGRSEIVEALQRLRAIYGPNSDASYSLFSAEDRGKILADLDMAEYHLLDTDRRTQYDREILKIGGTRHELPPPPQLPLIPPAPVMMETVPADTMRVRQPIGFRPPDTVAQPMAAVQSPPVVNAAAPVLPVRSPALPVVSAPVMPAPTIPEPPPAAGSKPANPVAAASVPSPAMAAKRPPVTQAARPVFPAKAPPVTVAAIPADRPKPDPAGFFQDQSDYTGKNLRRYREAVGYSLREIAAITRVSPQHLENIELDDFAHLPAPVYLKGFLKSYCKVLGLNLQTVVDGYMEHVRIFRELHNK